MGLAPTASPNSSLRAQRSDPESLRGNSLDCFAALAMTAERYSADSRTIWRPPLMSFRLLTKFSGRCQR
ncbi:hypothetical protein FXB38_30290 [Bradyrhizobium cytisi]|uniref:Uncharacterized protein n=1 Tax=Bradyrhizobium cytisi TaxID=515489 RepID=A0A5S4W586_9BRAD|nr:hypothetical protein FXB38_30290 [Bradyrhizobium cytisi]